MPEETVTAEQTAQMKALSTRGVEKAVKRGVPEQIATGEAFHDVSEPAPGVDSMRYMGAATTDCVQILDSDYEALGVDPETYRLEWCNEPVNTQGHRRDYIREFRANNPGAFMPTFKDGTDKGNPLYFRDLVCMANPRANVDAVQQRLAEARQRAQDEAENGIPEYSERQMREIRDQNRQALDRLLEGSPTRGRSLEKAGMMFTAEETEGIRDRYLPPRYHTYVEREKLRGNQTDRAVETIKNAVSGRGKTVGMGVGFDKAGNIVR